MFNLKGAKWTAAPKPLMTSASYVQNYPPWDSKEREIEIKKGFF